MTAQILVVDDTLSNLKLLEARLAAEYFEVVTATNGQDALNICTKGGVDLVLLDVMMPGMDGFETCRRLKGNPATAHIPVVMVTALDQPRDRVRGLEAGADDFLGKPFDEVSLIARVRSLTRLKVVLDELRNRASSTAVVGLSAVLSKVLADDGLGGRILLVDDRSSSVDRVTASLSATHKIDIEPDPQAALLRCVNNDYDLVIISLSLRDHDALRLCSQLRSAERTRQLPILIVADIEDKVRILRGLDMGVNDHLLRPIDRNELHARVRTQIRRKRYTDQLRSVLQSSIEMAVVDSLTGLNNRRYLEANLTSLLRDAAERGKPLSLMILDLDHFKSVNDTYGHDVGDEILRSFAGRVKKIVRSSDLMCRLGGEEFIIVLPDTNIEIAELVGERVRTAVGRTSFPIQGGARSIPVTVSIGVADRGRDVDSSDLLKRADLALYSSKTEGRNKVTAQAA